MQETTAGDRRATTPFLNGPAIIDKLYLNAQNDNTQPLPTISLFYGPSLPPSGNAVVTLAQLGTPIFTDGVLQTEAGGTFQTPIQHILKASGEAATMRIELDLRFPIFLDQFQLLIQFGTQTAGSQILTGHFRILERVPPELMPNFL